MTSSSHSGAPMRPVRRDEVRATSPDHLGAPISPDEMMSTGPTRSRGVAAPTPDGINLIESTIRGSEQSLTPEDMAKTAREAFGVPEPDNLPIKLNQELAKDAELAERYSAAAHGSPRDWAAIQKAGGELLIHHLTKPKPAAPTFQASTRQVLLEFPQKIRRARREEWELSVQIERLHLELKLLEANLSGAVAAEDRAASGKEKPWGNAEARDAEARRRLMEHPGAQGLRQQIDETRRRQKAVEAGIECWERMFRAADTIEKVDAVSSRTAVFFDLSEEGI